MNYLTGGRLSMPGLLMRGKPAPPAAAWLLAGLLLAVAGCETASRTLDAKATQTIKPGVTTREEIEKQFGKPTEAISGGGRTLLYYGRAYWGVGLRRDVWTSGDGYTRGLSVLLDKDNRVTRFHHSEHWVPTMRGPGTFSMGTKVDDNALSYIKTYSTTRTEALKLLGEPTMESLTLGGQLALDWIHGQGTTVSGWKRYRTVTLIINQQDVVITVRTYDGHHPVGMD